MIEYEYAVFERFEGRVEIVGRPYASVIEAKGYMTFLKEHPSGAGKPRSMFVRRRVVAGWENLPDYDDAAT